MHESDALIAIVGGGAATAAFVQRLRQLDYAGRIVLLTREDRSPYDRTALSKGYLLGDATAPRTLLRPGAPRERWMTGVECEQIDLGAHRLRAGDASIRYDRLFLALGAAALRLQLPGAQLRGIHVLRDLRDAESLARSLDLCCRETRRLLVVGGGWIGKEVAAAARSRGVQVVLAERSTRLGAAGTSASMAQGLERLHRAQSVDLRFESEVQAFDGHDRVETVRFSDGERIEVGAAVLGIGAAPEVDLPMRAGLHVQGGIAVDADGRSSDPHVYAGGDAASPRGLRDDRQPRPQSWLGAIRQGRRAAEAMLRDMGRAKLPATPGDAQHAFDSEQYGYSIRMADRTGCASSREIILDNEHGLVEAFRVNGALVGVAAIGHGQVFRELQRQLTLQPETSRTCD